jgi:flavin-dependent thymidylate synthase
MPSDEIARYADVAMYKAEAMERDEQRGVMPKVTLISATPMPLRTMAAATGLYAGKVYRHPADVPESIAITALDDMTKTALKAGLEFIDFHFLLEGVTRGFTHQLVRQRTAVYIQESMRFAVKEGAAGEVAYPPSIVALAEDDPRRFVWERACQQVADTYDMLISGGIPAEDARGLMPTNITTRVHYKTNLRGLMEHAGYRLCTQAQFEWRMVWAGIVKAIAEYQTDQSYNGTYDVWEFKAISKLFKPICYRTGKCEFMASVDRACSIRDRVQAHAAKGEPSPAWVDIHPAEWLADPSAARRSAAE